MLNVASDFLPIGHTLGFYHEQSRPDRDQLVEIKFDNIIEGMYYHENVFEVSAT